jgi:hypothetical protein
MMNQRNTQSGNLVHERELERQAALAKQIEQEQLLAELEEARRHRGMQSMGGDDGGGDGGGDE